MAYARPLHLVIRRKTPQKPKIVLRAHRFATIPPAPPQWIKKRVNMFVIRKRSQLTFGEKARVGGQVSGIGKRTTRLSRGFYAPGFRGRKSYAQILGS